MSAAVLDGDLRCLQMPESRFELLPGTRQGAKAGTALHLVGVGRPQGGNGRAGRSLYTVPEARRIERSSASVSRSKSDAVPLAGFVSVDENFLSSMGSNCVFFC